MGTDFLADAADWRARRVSKADAFAVCDKEDGMDFGVRLTGEPVGPGDPSEERGLSDRLTASRSCALEERMPRSELWSCDAVSELVARASAPTMDPRLPRRGAT